MVELNMEHVLILAIVAFLLYHFVGRCNCFNGNGFRVGGKPSFIGGDIWKDLETRAIPDPPHGDMWEDLETRAIPDPPHGDMWEDLKTKAQDNLCKSRIDRAVRAEKEACDARLDQQRLYQEAVAAEAREDEWAAARGRLPRGRSL